MGKGGQQPPKLEDLKLSRSGQPLITAENATLVAAVLPKEQLPTKKQIRDAIPAQVLRALLCLSVCACDQGHGRRGHVCLSSGLVTENVEHDHCRHYRLAGLRLLPGGGADRLVGPRARVRPRRLFRRAVRQRLRRTRTPPFLLVPYYSWQYSHAKHHAKTNHLMDGETHNPNTQAEIEEAATLLCSTPSGKKALLDFNCLLTWW